MQWDAGPQAGFTSSSSPWMRVMDSHTEINAAQQEHDPHSTLAFYRELIALRRAYPALLVYGAFQPCVTGEHTLVYLKKEHGVRGGLVGRTALVALNFSSEEQTLEWPEGVGERVGEKEMVLMSLGKEGAKQDKLRAWEARVYVY